jgi:hypothetical protein
MAEDEKPKQDQKKRIYTMMDMRELHKRDDYTAFGPMQLSTLGTAPIINIGRSTRDNLAKVYQSKESMKAHLGRPLSNR